MRYNRIPGTDVTVSELGFGVWTVSAGWWGAYSDEQAVNLLRRAYDRGVTFFDTADTYGNGRGETIMRQAFPGADRDDIVIGTKFGYDWESSLGKRREGHTEAAHCFEPAFLERALEGSLRRLGTDRIDVYQMHNVRMEHLLNDDVWTFVDKARQAGRVRSVGVALGPAIGWLEEGKYALEQCPVENVHMIYNALELDPGRELIETARATGKSLLVRVPHSSGMLEGHYTEETEFPEGDHRRHRPRAWLVNGVKKVRQLGFLTEENRSTLGQAALRYVLREPEVVSALPNIYDADQIDEFSAASDVPDITDAQRARIKDLYEANYGLPREQEAGVASR
ncbi:MAG: aldo/keto reductase [Dehalococcoidia bacterium]|nr:aldo/keto reductase [Dehalococcoidia bacterium]